MARRLSNKQFMAAMQTCGHLYSQAECGCIVLCMYDIPEVVNDAKADILEQAMKGRGMKRAARGEMPPFDCPTHAAERAVRAASLA